MKQKRIIPDLLNTPITLGRGNELLLFECLPDDGGGVSVALVLVHELFVVQVEYLKIPAHPALSPPSNLCEMFQDLFLLHVVDALIYPGQQETYQGVDIPIIIIYGQLYPPSSIGLTFCDEHVNGLGLVRVFRDRTDHVTQLTELK